MDNPLYDREVDAYPMPPESHAGGEPPTPGRGAKRRPPASGKSTAGPRPGSLAARFMGLGIPGLVGLGLAMGLLASAPMMLALSSRGERPRPASVAAPPRAEPSPPPPPPSATVGLAAVMDGVRRTASSTEWRRWGQPDPLLTAAIAPVLGEIRRATGDEGLGVPVWFGDVPPTPAAGADPAAGRVALDQTFHVASGPPPPDGPPDALTPAVLQDVHVKRAILVAHGDVVLSSATDCLIVATGAVQASYTSRCAIFAGRLIQVSHDTESLLVAGARVRVSHSYEEAEHPRHRRTIYAAPGSVSTNPHEGGVIVINAAETGGWLKDNCRLIEWPALDLGDEDRGRGNPLEGRVALVPVSSGTSYHGAVDIRVRGVPGNFLVRGSGPIVDESGRPVPGVEGWSVYRIAEGYTMVHRGDHLVDVDRYASRADPFAVPLRNRVPARGK